MEKAYNRVEWNFVLKILERFGFSSFWVNWIRQCILTSSFSILINGSPFGRIYPFRGLRQGDPISSYLFTLCSEILSRLLLQEESHGCLQGIQMGRNAPRISHLLFADDLLLFAKATLREASTLNDCLEKYMAWLGQKVNKSKSSVHLLRILEGRLSCPFWTNWL